MSESYDEIPLVRSVFHPTDFSQDSELAFVHALAVALKRQTKLTIMHVGGEGSEDDPWTGFPSVRRTLERWGLLEEGSPRSAVYDELRVRVQKVAVGAGDTVGAVLDFLREKPTDLIVLSTEGRDGLPRWIRGSVAEPLARRSNTMTLFVPRGARGFVSPEDGRLSLERVLVPVDHRPDPRAALQIAARTALAGGDGAKEMTVLHVGDGDDAPDVDPPEIASVSWHRVRRTGSVVDVILETAEQLPADLVVMVTEGHDGILDALRGSTTERVLRQAPCPVLAVPTAWVDAVTGKP